MIRAALDALLVFMVPFAVYAGILALGRNNPLHRIHWPTRRVLWLVVAGLACVVLSFIVTGLVFEGSRGAFVPTHVENGRVVPGQFR